jgi:putative ABC transport system permease protein
MTRYIWRTMFTEKGRLVLSVGGVALALMLIIALDAVFLGAERQSTRYIDGTDADVIVSQSGTRTMHMAASTLPAGLAETVRGMPEVASVTPVLFASDIVSAGETRASAYVIGLPPDTAAGLSEDVVTGIALPATGGAVVDQRLAKRAGLGIGDTVTVLGRVFRIDGLSRGTASLTSSVVIIPLADFAAIQGSTDTVSYLFVNVTPGASAQDVTDRMQASIDGVTVQTRAQFAAEERALIRDMGTNVIAVMNLLGFAIGLAVMALTIYLAMLSRRSEFGMLKAVGAPNRQLYRVVLLQSLASVGLGYLAAIAMTLGLAALLPQIGSSVSLAVGPASLTRVLIASIAIAGVAAILPVRRIAGLDPAMVFRER